VFGLRLLPSANLLIDRYRFHPVAP
jgi:hypothetical protein